MGQRRNGRTDGEFPEATYPLKSLTERIVAAAIEVHRTLGPGFVEQVYDNALALELEQRGHRVGRQVLLDVMYRDRLVGQHRLDLLVDDVVVVELKSVEALAEVPKAQLRSTLKAAGRKIGLLINFNQKTLTSGLKRVIN